MSLVFHCPSCGARFEAPEALAGKHARCKRCRGALTIPSPQEANVAAGGFRLSPAQQSAVALPVATAAAGPKRPRNWIEAVNSQVALQPLSMAAAPAVKKVLASPLDGPSFAGLYKVTSAPSLPATTSPSGRPGKPAGALARAYRGQLGGLQGLLRWINDSAYLLSVPFIALLIFGVVVHNRPLAMLGATLVVVLNIGRLVTGLANLVLIPFRESPIQGVLFLIPPITLFYCAAHWKKVKKPLKRIIEPALTLGAVVAAFAFVPWLGGKAPKGDLQSQITSGMQELKSGVQQEMGNLPQNLQQLPQKAGEILKKGTEGAQPASSNSPSAPPVPGPLDQLKGVSNQLKSLREGQP